MPTLAGNDSMQQATAHKTPCGLTEITHMDHIVMNKLLYICVSANIFELLNNFHSMLIMRMCEAYCISGACPCGGVCSACRLLDCSSYVSAGLFPDGFDNSTIQNNIRMQYINVVYVYIL